MNNVLDVTAYIIKKSLKDNTLIDNLKLQKILYYVQACSLKNKNKTMFKENIFAYPYGPHVPEVYEQYKRNVATFIYYVEDEENVKEISNEDKQICDFIIDKFKSSSAWDLVIKTHYEDPYSNTPLDDVISLDAIKSYFDDKDEFNMDDKNLSSVSI